MLALFDSDATERDAPERCAFRPPCSYCLEAEAHHEPPFNEDRSAGPIG